jgi:hypothetical protein
MKIIILLFYFYSLSLLKKSIVILKDDDYEIYSKCDDCICIVYDEKEMLYKIYNEYTNSELSFFTELMINKRMKKYIDNDINEKLNNIYIKKDLKDIADKLKF